MRMVFGQSFLANPAHNEQIAHWKQEFLRIKRRHIARVIAGLLVRQPFYDSLYKIRKPTLIIAGEQDQATTRYATNRLSNSITGAHLIMVPDTGHTVNLEKPTLINNAIF